MMRKTVSSFCGAIVLGITVIVRRHRNPLPETGQVISFFRARRNLQCFTCLVPARAMRGHSNCPSWARKRRSTASIEMIGASCSPQATRPILCTLSERLRAACSRGVFKTAQPTFRVTASALHTWRALTSRSTPAATILAEAASSPSVPFPNRTWER